MNRILSEDCISEKELIYTPGAPIEAPAKRISADVDGEALEKGERFAREIKERFVAGFEKPGDQMVHVSTFAVIGETVYVTYYANVNDPAEDPTRQTARDAITCGSMYVMERSGTLVAAGKIDHIQPPSYTDINWSIPAVEHEVLVLHTLVVHPDYSGEGIAKTFIRAYENMAAEKGCTCLRIDTNARNTRARSLYKRLGYTERGIIPCCFNGIEGVELVCLEKLL